MSKVKNIIENMGNEQTNNISAHTNTVEQINLFDINMHILRQKMALRNVEQVSDEDLDALSGDIDIMHNDNNYITKNLSASFNDVHHPLEDSFPYDNMRNAQRYIVEKLKLCDDKKFILIEAMPGTGKSAIAKMIASHFGSGYILTATKQLQDQYTNEFPDIYSIKGKANYECGLSKGLSCKQAVCEKDFDVARKCIQDGCCPYYIAKSEAQRARLTITSYACFFTWLKKNSMFNPRSILILDECHLLDAQVTTWTSINLNIYKLQNKYKIFTPDSANQDLNKFMLLSATEFEEGWTETNRRFVTELYDVLLCRCRELVKELSRLKQSSSSLLLSEDDNDTANEQTTNEKKLLRLKDALYRLTQQLKIFLNSSNKEEWLITPNTAADGSRELIIQPLYISRLFKEYINKFGIKHVVFMSATILNAKLFFEELGINKNEVGIIRVDSSFDPAKSPIYYLPVGKMNYHDLPNTIPKIISKVKAILHEHADSKGIIHTGNYRIAEEIYKAIPNHRFIMKRGFETNEELIERHKRSINGVLLSPSLNTGTDLKDELSRFQIIVKMPFLSLADKRIKKKAEINKQWYVCEMLRTLIQASGRSTRSEEDFSITYILDSSFKYWINEYKNWLPKQFLQRIK